jgi:hypothetical protein
MHVSIQTRLLTAFQTLKQQVANFLKKVLVKIKGKDGPAQSSNITPLRHIGKWWDSSTIRDLCTNWI